MAEIVGEKAELRARQGAIEVFLGALAKGSKTVALYKSGHPIIMQICERVHATLMAAIGQEPNLLLDIKAKQVLCGENPLTEGEETVFFAAALHTLGIGQVLFTNRIVKEGLYEFMKLLVLKPDGKVTLADLQRNVQDTRIDGMQLVFIQSFVVTGEEDESKQAPGLLTEEQIQAFTAARNAPDFLHLLFRQNEPLTSKAAEEISDLLDGVLNRDLSLEKFEAGMPWAAYDPRIRERWEQLTAGLRERRKWDRDALFSRLCFVDEADLAARREHAGHEAKESLRFALDKVHEILANPAGEKQPKYAMQAYARVLEDVARAGDAACMLDEYELWLRMPSDPDMNPHVGVLKAQIQARVPKAPLMESFAAHAVGVEPGTPQASRLGDFIVYLGDGAIPLLLEELRKASDRAQRARLSSLIAGVCRRLGVAPLVQALADEDYFLVVNVVGIFAEIGDPNNLKSLLPLLQHKHPKVRETVIRLAGKSGGPECMKALAAFIASGAETEEAKQAVTALSLIQAPGVDESLIGAYPRTGDYDVQVAIATVLGRLPSPRTQAFLETVAVWNWLEWLTGRNKALRHAARQSLHQVKREAGSLG